MRFMYLAYGTQPYYLNDNHAYNIISQYNNTGKHLDTISNGTPNAIAPGDILAFNTSMGIHGHTGFVKQVSLDDAGNGFVNLIEQNANVAGSRSVTVSNWHLGGGVFAWLHKSQ
jgi:hypothetical protein